MGYPLSCTHCCKQGYVPNHPYAIWHHSHFRELETPRLFDEDDGGRDYAYKHFVVIDVFYFLRTRGYMILGGVKKNVYKQIQ